MSVGKIGKLGKQDAFIDFIKYVFKFSKIASRVYKNSLLNNGFDQDASDF